MKIYVIKWFGMIGINNFILLYKRMPRKRTIPSKRRSALVKYFQKVLETGHRDIYGVWTNLDTGKKNRLTALDVKLFKKMRDGSDHWYDLK
jgi:hypothetical protein